MLHRESIPIEDYTNEFKIPYLAEFADTFRKYVVKSGVKSCFCLDIPIYLPGTPCRPTDPRRCAPS